MKMYSRTIPYGYLPYEDTISAAKMIVKLFEHLPYLPFMPKLNDISIIDRTLKDIPGVGNKDGRYILLKDYEKFKLAIESLDDVYNSMTNLSKYASFPTLWVDFLHIVKTSAPKQAIINLLGPMTLADYLKREEHPCLLTDKYGRKFLVQAISIKAMAYIEKLKEAQPDIRPLIIIEDNALSSLSQLKRDNADITNDFIISLYAKIVEKIHEAGADVCIQCFNKCDWQVPIDSGVDMISFDAFTNPNNLCIIPDKINEFLARGGYINWAIVPAKSDNFVKSLTIDYVYNQFIKTIENLINEGVDVRLTYNRSTVSTQNNLKDLSILFAEKVCMLSVQLGKKIPAMK